MKHTIDISTLSKEDLKQLLAQKEAQDAKERAESRKAYEAYRDKEMKTLVEQARELSEKLFVFKGQAHAAMELHAEKLAEYGKIRSNSKGGFSLQNTQGDLKLKRRRDTLRSWDERSEKALDLIKDFLQDTVKKKDVKLFEILLSFISKNQKGDLEYSKVMQLLTHEDKYSDQRWKEGLRLIRESYSHQLKGFQYEFWIKNPKTEKFERVDLNFSHI